METAIKLIVEKRKRQQQKHKYTSEHDETHISGELSQAAACLAEASSAMIRGAAREEIDSLYTGIDASISWPWPTPIEDSGDDRIPLDENIIENLVNAAALIVAEIERLRRTGYEPLPQPDPNQMTLIPE